MKTLRHLLAALSLAFVTLTGAPVVAAEINDLNVTDASNTARFPEGMAPSAVNNGARALEGIMARWHKDTNASIAAGGTANAATVAANQGLSAYFDGLEIAFNATLANTAAVTLDVDAIGAKKVFKNFNVELVADDIKAGQKVVVIFDSDGDGGAGAWQMVTPANVSGSAALADGSVTTAKLAANAVTIPKLSADAAPIVGEVKSYIGTTAPTGWLLLNGDTIGSAASLAAQKSDGFQTLFELLWNSMADTEAAVVGGRGVSANADWVANKAITLPDARGRSIIGTGAGVGLNVRNHGITSGSEDAVVASHTHADTFSIPSGGTHNHNLRVTDQGPSTFVASAANILSDAASAFGDPDIGGSVETNGANIGTSTSGSHSHTVNGAVSTAGVSPTDANMSPFLALNMIIKF